MKKKSILICLFFFLVSWNNHSKAPAYIQDLPINGDWYNQLNSSATITFRTAYDKNRYDYIDVKGEIQVWGLYELHGKQVYFNDEGGNMCDSTGIYRYDIYKDTLKLLLVRDGCKGRIDGIAGKWVRKK